MAAWVRPSRPADRSETSELAGSQVREHVSGEGFLQITLQGLGKLVVHRKEDLYTAPGTAETLQEREAEASVLLEVCSSLSSLRPSGQDKIRPRSGSEMSLTLRHNARSVRMQI